MKEIFLAVCLATGVDCNNVSVGYNALDFDTAAQASMLRSGRYIIDIHNHTKKASELKILLVHEMSHIMLWETGNLSPTHGTEYLLLCRGLAHKMNISSKACSPYADAGSMSHFHH